VAKLVLYFAPGASSMAVHIALNEAGAPFEGKPISFKKGDLKTEAFRKINAEGKVPTMLIDGRPLTEVAGCLLYLARSYPAANLLPKDVEGEARAVSWMSFIASTLHPARRQGLEHVKQVWRIAEQRLGNNEWVLGTYSIADIHLFRLWWRVVGSMKPERAEFPRLYAHYDRMMARPAVKRTIEAESKVGYELPA
jgi:glutathione S-transferase